MIPVTFFYNSTLLTRIYFDKLVIYPKHSFVLLRLCGLYKNRVRELFGKAILMQSRPIGYGTIGNQKASDYLFIPEIISAIFSTLCPGKKGVVMVYLTRNTL